VTSPQPAPPPSPGPGAPATTRAAAPTLQVPPPAHGATTPAHTHVVRPVPTAHHAATTSTPAGPAAQPHDDSATWSTGAAIVSALAAVVAIVISISAKRANWAMVKEQAKANCQHREEVELLKTHRQEEKNEAEAARQAAQRDRAEDLAASQATAATHERQEAAEALAQARMITVGIGPWANAVDVVISNESPSDVAHVEVVNVALLEQPEWKWEPDLYAHSRTGDPLACTVLLSHGEHVFHVQFKNEAGEEQRAGSGMDFEVTYRFTDVGRRRWERTDDGDPRLAGR
jgi:hypothetical protein